MSDQRVEIETGTGLVLVVNANDLGIEIGIKGYGVAEEDDGSFIYIDTFSGVPELIVWADINKADPTHRIDFSNALESNRRECD